jgi:hypothetical protein
MEPKTLPLFPDLLVVVLLGSHKIFQLRGGGESVAQMLNARKLFPAPTI